MIKSLTAATCALALTATLAFAQSSQPQGGANQSPNSPTSETSKDSSMTKGTTGMSTHKKDMKKKHMKSDKENMKQ